MRTFRLETLLSVIGPPASDASPQNLTPRMRDSTIHEEFFVAAGGCKKQMCESGNKSLPLEKIYGIYIHDHMIIDVKMVMESLYIIDLQLRVHYHQSHLFERLKSAEHRAPCRKTWSAIWQIIISELKC